MFLYEMPQSEDVAHNSSQLRLFLIGHFCNWVRFRILRKRILLLVLVEGVSPRCKEYGQNLETRI